MRNSVFIVAQKEWFDGWRNQWVTGVTVIFAFMALGITWFGSVTSGQTGFVSIDATIASLASLTVIVIPLIALLLGYDAFVGEHEQGTLILLLTYPLTKAQLVLGKFIGQLAILFVATLIGFGSAFVLLMFKTEAALLIPFATFIGSASLLGAVFLALGHLLSLFVSEKAQAAGLALLVWFLFALLYDIALLALLVGSSGWISPTLLKGLLMFNPTDLFRIINLVQLDAQGTGALASLGHLQFSLPILFALLLVWIGSALGLSMIKLSNKKI